MEVGWKRGELNNVEICEFGDNWEWYEWVWRVGFVSGFGDYCFVGRFGDNCFSLNIFFKWFIFLEVYFLLDVIWMDFCIVLKIFSWSNRFFFNFLGFILCWVLFGVLEILVLDKVDWVFVESWLFCG